MGGRRTMLPQQPITATPSMTHPESQAHIASHLASAQAVSALPCPSAEAAQWLDAQSSVTLAIKVDALKTPSSPQLYRRRPFSRPRPTLGLSSAEEVRSTICFPLSLFGGNTQDNWPKRHNDEEEDFCLTGLRKRVETALILDDVKH